MAARFKRGFNHPWTVVDERPHRVADHFGAGKQLDQFVDRVAGFGDFIVRSLDAGDMIHDLLNFAPVPARSYKGNVVLA